MDSQSITTSMILITQSRTHVIRKSEGLYCRLIDENKANMFTDGKFAATNPFEYQEASRLVYCNLLEHLILHVKIAENPNIQTNKGELPGTLVLSISSVGI